MYSLQLIVKTRSNHSFRDIIASSHFITTTSIHPSLHIHHISLFTPPYIVLLSVLASLLIKRIYHLIIIISLNALKYLTCDRIEVDIISPYFKALNKIKLCHFVRISLMIYFIIYRAVARIFHTVASTQALFAAHIL